MKDKNTIATLTASASIAIAQASALETIAEQISHPTIELERQQAAKQAHAWAQASKRAIEDLNDMHTEDAKEMTAHFMSIAKRLEDKAETIRVEIPYISRWETIRDMKLDAMEKVAAAGAWRYAAQLIADENNISM